MSTVITKRSTVPGKVPTISDIVEGQLAVNLADAKLYTRQGSTIKEIGGGTSGGGVSEELAMMYAIALGG